MLTSEFETNRERRVSPTHHAIYQSAGSRASPALGCCYPRPNHDTLVCSNAFATPQEANKQHLRVEPRPSSLDYVQTLRIVCSPFQHDQCVGIDSANAGRGSITEYFSSIFDHSSKWQAPPQPIHKKRIGASSAFSLSDFQQQQKPLIPTRFPKRTLAETMVGMVANLLRARKEHSNDELARLPILMTPNRWFSVDHLSRVSVHHLSTVLIPTYTVSYQHSDLEIGPT